MYEYAAVVRRVIDGDTVDLDIDLGMGVWKHGERIRLHGLNAADRNLQAKRDAAAFVRNLLPVGRACVVRTYRDKTEKYGRYLGVIVVDLPEAGLVSVNELLLLAGHALPWDGVGLSPERGRLSPSSIEGLGEASL